MSGLSSQLRRAHPQGSCDVRQLPSIVAAVLALVFALSSSALTSDRSRLPVAQVKWAAPALNAYRPAPRLADFGAQNASVQARQVADWILDSRDNAGAEFVLVDKTWARVYVFDATGQLRGSSPVLLGAAHGDDSVPGIGVRPIADVLTHERTTPAGRFVAERGRNTSGEDVVWVDYDAAVSMHRVRATDPKERRLQRLASPTADDNRISYGCINVPVAFYESTIRPMFADRNALVYVLPETRSAREVFDSYVVEEARSAEAAHATRVSHLR